MGDPRTTLERARGSSWYNIYLASTRSFRAAMDSSTSKLAPEAGSSVRAENDTTEPSGGKHSLPAQGSTRHLRAPSTLHPTPPVKPTRLTADSLLLYLKDPPRHVPRHRPHRQPLHRQGRPRNRLQPRPRPRHPPLLRPRRRLLPRRLLPGPMPVRPREAPRGGRGCGAP